jgi:hypothetical protein
MENMHRVELPIGISDEIVEVHCRYEDSDRYPEIHKVVFEEIDILGCLSGAMIDGIEEKAHLALKDLFSLEKGEAQIDEWVSQQYNKGDLS